jgi:hypothetical protein
LPAGRDNAAPPGHGATLALALFRQNFGRPVVVPTDPPQHRGAVHAFCHAIPTRHQMGGLSAADSPNWLSHDWSHAAAL